MEKNNPEYWRQKIADWKASNQELRLWCRENQVNVKQFCSWKSQFEKEDKEAQKSVFAELLSSPTNKPQQAGSYSSTQDHRFMLYFQGMKLYIPDHFDEETFLSLLKVMKQV